MGDAALEISLLGWGCGGWSNANLVPKCAVALWSLQGKVPKTDPRHFYTDSSPLRKMLFLIILRRDKSASLQGSFLFFSI